MVLTRISDSADFIEGSIILIDKPLHWTSYDVVKKLRNLLSKTTGMRKIKVGHAGTLDPLASGLLIVCTGKATKQIQFIQDAEKEYEGSFYVGATTPSFDLETEINETFPTEHISESLIQEKAKEFTGEISQLPPVFSAIKKDGKPVYLAARKGIDVKLEPRIISIYQLDVWGNIPDLYFRTQCSKGTYIRSLANDFGKALGSGAYLQSLRRTKTGEYDVKDAWEIEPLIEFIKNLPVKNATV
jgi:tRNA pseudouridine55 synthase